MNDEQMPDPNTPEWTIDARNQASAPPACQMKHARVPRSIAGHVSLLIDIARRDVIHLECKCGRQAQVKTYRPDRPV